VYIALVTVVSFHVVPSVDFCHLYVNPPSSDAVAPTVNVAVSPALKGEYFSH